MTKMQNVAELETLRSDRDREDDLESALERSNSLVSSASSSNSPNTERGHWANKTEFFLAIMGYTVGIGSVWRFPIICSRNGGGAFLIPFYFFLITCGGPLYYLEVCLGQFTGMSAALSFEFCPLLKGIGLLQWTLSFTVLWYLVLILAWSIYFLYSSFFPTLPWESCNNPWNTPQCTELSEFWKSDVNTTASNMTYDISNMTLLNQTVTVADKTADGFSSSVFEYWEYNVIARSTGLSDLGPVQPHLAICLLLAWLFIVAAVIKGVKTLGKVVYVTATAPFIFLTIMLVRGLTLDGSMDGIIFYLKPDFKKLLEMQSTMVLPALLVRRQADIDTLWTSILKSFHGEEVWLEAAVQVFYSLGPCWGGVITMASYNRFHQKSFWSSTWCVIIAGFTSFYNGLVVMTILGFMAKESGLSVEEVAKQSGPGLAFVAFPTAISRMPLPHLWSVLFFLMLITVVFDSMFGMFETITSGIIDLFPRQLISKRILVNIAVGVVFFLAGLPLATNGGIYIFQLSDWYFSQFGLLFGSLFELIGICWIYGMDRFSNDIKLMMGRDVSVMLRCMWGIVVPLFTIISFIVLLSKYSAPDYGDGYVYEASAIIVGIFVGMLPIAAVLVVAGLVLCFGEGSLMNRFRQSLYPSSSWLPYDHLERKTYNDKPYVYQSTVWKRIVTNIRGSDNV